MQVRPHRRDTFSQQKALHDLYSEARFERERSEEIGGCLKPYYEHAGITIYHGDCREILSGIASADLVLTDPPYGMNYKPMRGADGSKRFTEGVIGDSELFDPSPLMRFGRAVLWGANWYPQLLPPSGGWIVWDKTPKGRKEGFAASDAELAWTNLRGSVLKFSMQWGGEAHGGEPHFHPTQKPVALMEWIIARYSDVGGMILDPYTGSGPVLIAAKNLRRQAIGIEIDERYCEIAAKRLSQEVMDFTEVSA
jgi:16S rRNA G966 N2-methylase RsmD